MRQAVAGMLAADEDAPAILDASLDGLTALVDQPTIANLLGQEIGPYTVLRELGRGGMGTVYLAERRDIQKQVALKLVRDPLASPERVQRFLFEQRVLARLEHPHIARLLDAGVTEQGTPYFAMDYVAGLPIDVYCETHRLSIDERLALFEQVCQAVQFAHQNLVVHRDLKPSNILVREGGAVKLLDFGIAKLLEQDEAEELMLTCSGMRVMTPDYAAPEQMRGEGVTTATDVYALGVVLYHLLTGRRPYMFSTGSMVDAEKVICGVEPEKPSTVIRQEVKVSGDAAPSVMPEHISAARQIPLHGLRRRLRGDLDTILLTALQKDPERRYQHAGLLLSDLKRHRAGLPIMARKDSWGYRAQKFSRRHIAGLTVAVLALVVLLGFGLFYTLRVTQERDRAELAFEKANYVAAFLEEMLSEADPAQSRGTPLNAVQMLDRGAKKVEQELSGQPALQAELFSVMAHVYLSLGRFEQAEPLVQKGLTLRKTLYGPSHPEVAKGLYDLGTLLAAQSAYPEAEEAFSAALAIYQTSLGDVSPEGVETLGEIARMEKAQGDYAGAEPLLRKVLQQKSTLFGEEHPVTVNTLNQLGGLLLRMNRHDEAGEVFGEVLALRRKNHGALHPDVAAALNNLAIIRLAQEKFVEAERLFRENLQIVETLYEGPHPRVASALQNLALTLQRKGAYEEAETHYRATVAITRQIFNAHPALASALLDFGILLALKEAYPEAESSFREALAIYRDMLGDEHEDTAKTRYHLGVLLLDTGRVEEAAPHLRESLDLIQAAYPDDKAGIGRGLVGWGAYLMATGDFESSEASMLEGYALLQEKTYTTELQQMALQRIVALYEQWGKPAQAAAYSSQMSRDGI